MRRRGVGETKNGVIATQEVRSRNTRYDEGVNGR